MKTKGTKKINKTNQFYSINKMKKQKMRKKNLCKNNTTKQKN